MRKYYSSYTGSQIDEAVRAIIENGITVEDFSPELVAEIKQWIAEGSTSEGAKELVFSSHYQFPSVGQIDKLYIAQDEEMIYYYFENRYVPLKGVWDITFINCGGAEENGN